MKFGVNLLTLFTHIFRSQFEENVTSKQDQNKSMMLNVKYRHNHIVRVDQMERGFETRIDIHMITWMDLKKMSAELFFPNDNSID